MPTSKSAAKRVRQNEKQRERNRAERTRARRQIKKARQALEGADAGAADAVVAQTTKVLDKVASKGVWHKRKVARLKSRLAKKANALRNKLG